MIILLICVGVRDNWFQVGRHATFDIESGVWSSRGGDAARKMVFSSGIRAAMGILVGA